MASLLPRNLPSASSTSCFSPVHHFQSTAAKGPAVVVAMAKNVSGDGGRTEVIMRQAMMDPDAKRPWWLGCWEVKVPVSEEKEERPRTANRSGLTAEKARLLRKELRATEGWHDAMYHSAIASRLACPDHT